LIRIDAIALLAQDVAHVRHFVRILVNHETPELFGRIGDKQFATRGGYITAAILLEDAELFRRDR